MVLIDFYDEGGTPYLAPEQVDIKRPGIVEIRVESAFDNCRFGLFSCIVVGIAECVNIRLSKGGCVVKVGCFDNFNNNRPGNSAVLIFEFRNGRGHLLCLRSILLTSYCELHLNIDFLAVVTDIDQLVHLPEVGVVDAIQPVHVYLAQVGVWNQRVVVKNSKRDWLVLFLNDVAVPVVDEIVDRVTSFGYLVCVDLCLVRQ